MPEAHLNITGDSGSALAAIAQVKGAIAGLTGKTIDVNVNVNQRGGGLAGLSALNQSLRDGTDAARDHARASDRSSASTRDHASASDRAASSAGGHAAAVERVSRWMNEVGPATSRASSAMSTMGDSADRAGGGLEHTGDGLDYVSKTSTRMGDSVSSGMGSASRAMNAFSNAAMVAGVTAGVSVVGMGALAAVAGGAALGGAVGLISQSGPAMNVARKAATAFGQEFDDMSSKTAAFLPQMRGLAAAAVGVGGALADVGIKNMGASLESAASVATSTSGMISALEPAMAPSLRAAASLYDGLASAVGNSAGEIANFAGSVDAASPGVGKMAESIIGGMAAIGGVTMDTLGAIGDSGMFTPEVAGGLMGAIPGAMTGAMIGTLALGPGVGTFGGAAIGGIAGAIGGAGAVKFWDGGEGSSIVGQEGGRFDKGAGTAYNPDLPASMQGAKTAGMPQFTPGSTFDQQAATAAASGAKAESAARAGAGDFGPQDTPAPVGSKSPDKGSYTGRPASDFPGIERAPQTDASKAATAAEQKTQQGMASGGSSGPTIANAAAMRELNTQATATTGALNGTAAAGANFGSTMGSSMGQAQQATAQGAQGVQQSMQAVNQTAQAPPPAPPTPPAPPAMPAPEAPPASAISAPMQKNVQTAVQDVASTGASSGASVGSAVGSGMNQAMTESQTATKTIMRTWVETIIDVFTGGMGIASPSRVSYGWGLAIGQGVVGGAQASTPAVASSIQSMVGAVTQAGQGQMQTAATQMGSQLAQSAQQAAQNQQNQTKPGQDDPNRPQLGGRYGPGTDAYQAEQQQLRVDQQKEDAEAAKQQETQARQDTYAQTFDKMGYSEDTKDRLGKDRDKHNLEAAGRESLRDIRKATAIDRLKPENFGKGKDVGSGIPAGMEKGVQSGEADAVDAAKKLSDSLIEETKKRTQTRSPSKLTTQVGSDVAAGFGVGIASGIDAATDIARGVADDRGLQLGYRYATSMATGAASVIKTDLFKAAGLPQIDSPQAKRWLGMNEMMGSAGSGAQVWKSPQVTLGGAGSQPIQVISQIYFDGKEIDPRIDTKIEGLTNQIANMLKLQRT